MIVKQLFFIAAGGAIGAVGRFLINDLIHKKLEGEFPYGTLTVNVVGCFLIGLLLQIETQSQWLTPSHRALLVTGFLGALTTFSTFGHDTLRCANSNLTLAMLNIGSNVLFGILAVGFGIITARFFSG